MYVPWWLSGSLVFVTVGAPRRYSAPAPGWLLIITIPCARTTSELLGGTMLGVGCGRYSGLQPDFIYPPLLGLISLVLLTVPHFARIYKHKSFQVFL